LLLTRSYLLLLYDVTSFFFHDTALPEIYTLSLHDALPICCVKFFPKRARPRAFCKPTAKTCKTVSTVVFSRPRTPPKTTVLTVLDRKSTRLNSSHVAISYAVFCLKKKNR